MGKKIKTTKNVQRVMNDSESRKTLYLFLWSLCVLMIGFWVGFFQNWIVTLMSFVIFTFLFIKGGKIWYGITKDALSCHIREKHHVKIPICKICNKTEVEIYEETYK